MNLSKERSLVLEMISDGQITVDEGEELFQALNASVKKDTVRSIDDGTPLDSGFEPISPPPPIPPIPAIPPIPPIPAIPPIRPIRAMGARSLGGFRNDDVEELLAELSAAGIDHLTQSDLQELYIHHITPDYVREIVALGFQPEGISEWIEMRIHNITPHNVRAYRSLGLDDLEVSDLVELSIHNISPKFVSEMTGLGYGVMDVGELVESRKLKNWVSTILDWAHWLNLAFTTLPQNTFEKCAS